MFRSLGAKLHKKNCFKNRQNDQFRNLPIKMFKINFFLKLLIHWGPKSESFMLWKSFKNAQNDQFRNPWDHNLFGTHLLDFGLMDLFGLDNLD